MAWGKLCDRRGSVTFRARGGCELALGIQALNTARKSSTARYPARWLRHLPGLPLKSVDRIATVRDAGSPLDCSKARTEKLAKLLL